MAEDTQILSFCYNNEVELLKEALLLGVDPNTRDFRGRSGLHIAAMHGGDEAMRVLLEAGADATVVDSQGNTPLHMCGHKETVQTLIEFGAQVLTRNARGDTPLNLMHRRGVGEDVLEIMEQFGGDEDMETRIESPVLQQQGPKPNSIERVKNIWYEFCNDLGVERLAMLLVFVLCISLYVAYTITGYSKMIDTRIPVDFESQRVEL